MSFPQRDDPTAAATAPGRVGVVGAGTMGIGVAHLFAVHGVPVTLVDVSAAALSRAAAHIETNTRLYPLLDRGLAVADPAQVLDRITLTGSLGDLGTADLVVENVTERWEVKAAVYPELDAVAPAHCIFGVNTSAIPITRVAALTGRPGLVIGTHFMNPAPLKPLVEVVRGRHTDPATVARTRQVLRLVGKDCVVVDDSPGFVTNRVAMLTVNEAILLVQEGVAPPADVDRLFQQCFGHPMGPLRTADLIGLDTVLYSLEVLREHLKDDKFAPAALLRELVAAGHLGQKSGRGFYPYEEVTTKDGAPA